MRDLLNNTFIERGICACCCCKGAGFLADFRSPVAALDPAEAVTKPACDCCDELDQLMPIYPCYLLPLTGSTGLRAQQVFFDLF